ncbi:hypothetical protein [Mycolicibacterium komossense]|uniref:Scaffolding protein n=1 Tax=Mycolicibacterium komossense TaxID=1779 RepID=A0ABT3C4P4_9MYCO|nr:hypothetical protein [Mycolicibacterium komossense]MCV7224447.1 hypothetical protein [Mycolicibacterium komossense]
MSDTIPETPTIDGASSAGLPATPAAPTHDEGANEPQKVNKEAQYRVQRNEARTERDALAAKVEQMQRAEVERLASDGLSHPADLFSLSGNEVADYLTDSGDVDAAKVAADVSAVLAERPGLRRNSPAFDPTQGHGGGKAPEKRLPTMADFFQASTDHTQLPSVRAN